MSTNGTTFGIPAGADDLKYTLQARFTNLTQTEISNLQRFMWWQNRGNLLCLQTGLNDLPPWLVGRLEITGDKGYYDLAKGTINLKFVEA